MSTNSNWDPWNYRTGTGLGSDATADARRDLTGAKVQATDGHIGKVDSATYETGGSYFVVDTGPWIFGKKVLLPAAVIRGIDADSGDVLVDLTKDQIKDSPEFGKERTDWTDSTHRDDVGAYYGRHYGGY